MTGIFAFPIKPTNKDYIWCKSPKQAVEVDDDTILKVKTNSCYIHWQDDWDNLTDKDVIEKVNQHDGYSYSIKSRKTGLGYSNDDKTKYIRIIRNSFRWFHERL